MHSLFLQTIGGLVPANTPESLIEMLTANTLLHADAPLRLNDILHLALPGALALEVKAELIEVSPESRWKAVLRDRLRLMPGVLALRFSAPLPTLPEPPETPPQNPYAHDFPEIYEPILLDAFVVTAMEDSLLYFHRRRGETETIREGEFASKFTHLVRLQRTGERSGSLHERINETLTRFVAYADAYPDRVIRKGERDAPAKAKLAEFLHDRGKKERNRTGTQLRKAADALNADAFEEAFALLKEIIIPDLQLPTAAEDALLNPETPLSPVQLRETLYLARAGLPLPRTMVASRLHSEIESPDIAKTLHLMRYDVFPWARAAALPPPLCFPVACRPIPTPATVSLLAIDAQIDVQVDPKIDPEIDSASKRE